MGAGPVVELGTGLWVLQSAPSPLSLLAAPGERL